MTEKQQLHQELQEDKKIPLDLAGSLQILLNRVGGEGRFQFISLLVFNGLWFTTSWLLLGTAFFFDAEFKCENLDNKDKCYDFVCSAPPSARNSLIYSHASSIIFQFEQLMICDDYGYIATVLQSMVFAGGLLGFLIIPYIADNFGRKYAIVISWQICTLGVFMVALSPSQYTIGIGYFLAGFGSNPAITLSYSFINQQCTGKTREKYGTIIQILFAIGQSTIGLIFLANVAWRNAFYILLAMSILCLLSLFYLVQTPHFLIKKNPQEALRVLNIIAQRNKNQLLQLQDMKQAIDLSNNQSEEKQHFSVIDLFRYKSLRWISISCGAIFFGIQIIYYSTSLNLSEAGFNKYVNQQIIGVSEMMGYITAEVIISRVNRRKSTFIGVGVATAMCGMLALLTIFRTDDNYTLFTWLQTVGLIINRFVLCCFWSIFYVFIGELYPMKVRSLAFGWSSCMGTVGSTLSPYIIFASNKLRLTSWLAPTLIGALSFTFAFCLHQTKGLPLPVEIAEKQTILTLQ